MPNVPEPPKTYRDFLSDFPQLEEAWRGVTEAGQSGPLDAKTRRLVKLGIAIGAMREGAFHASVRKALAEGITNDEFKQVLALAAGTMGFPATVAAYSWMKDVTNPGE